MPKPEKSPATTRDARATMARRFMRLESVAEALDVSTAQAHALVRSGELPAIKVGGRGQWRVEVAELDAFIARMYEQTKAFVAATPYPSAVWKEEPAGD